ncbi:hypothetical protein L0663_04910 [Dyadobacter sp. CY107]|uniref:hypothetical protein n=1 Tax=Dyadobacter fanqingshengii TaxID=2906443 RepID=UPI001F2AB0FB|nr:hypothetical protein [Dyadobacter fanqingshengii]MCF2502706.1 hypothetical protein [Dyadobacter fanqingshengii]
MRCHAIWANAIWASADEAAEEVVVDNASNVYVTGTHSNYFLTPLGVGSGGDANVFLGKWNADGQNAIRGRNGVSDGATDYAGGIAFTSSNNVLVYGTFSGTGQFAFNEVRLLTLLVDLMFLFEKSTARAAIAQGSIR